MAITNPHQSYKQGELIFSEGEPGSSAYIITKGKVNLYILVDGKSVLITTLEEGQVFGEMSLIDSQIRSATAKASEHTELTVISRSYFNDKLKSADEFVLLLLNVTLNHYREMRVRLENIMSEEAIDRDKIFVTHEKQKQNKDILYTTQQLQREENLKKAFEQNHLELFYQPIISLKSNTIAGCEALIRWRHPEKGLIPPIDFIGLAEESGLIVPIGLWIIEEACRALNQFNKVSTKKLSFMSINLSGRQFTPPDLVDNIKQIFEKNNIDASTIKFEITESILMANPIKTINTLNEIKNIGAYIAIDDFGTGYSSFSYLHRFPIDSLKIDQSFTSTMQENPKSFEIVKSLCTLANSLKMSVIAEGIEHECEKNSLNDLNADFGQGYLYSKPLPHNEFIDFILNWKE